MTVKELIEFLKNPAYENMRVWLTLDGVDEMALFVSAYENRSGVLIEGNHGVDLREEIATRKRDLTTEEFLGSLVDSGFSWSLLKDTLQESDCSEIEREMENLGVQDKMPEDIGGMLVGTLITMLEKQNQNEPVFIGQYGTELTVIAVDPDNSSLPIYLTND